MSHEPRRHRAPPFLRHSGAAPGRNNAVRRCVPTFAMGGLINTLPAVSGFSGAQARRPGAEEGAGRPITVQVVINTPDIGSFRASANQVSAQMALMLQRAQKRNG